jgi:hypothetical protein
MMGGDVFSGTSFIDVADGRVTIHLPRKMCLSISTAHAIRTRNREAKRGKLKRF